jgi:hypothetical protein
MSQVRSLLWIALAIAVVRLGYIGLIRHESRTQLNQTVENRNACPADDHIRDTGHGLRITQFYAREREVVDGEQGLICYGVRDAVSVVLDPPVEELSPTLTRCFFVEPRRDTEYTLTAQDGSGQQVRESLTLRVRPAPAEIRMIATSERKIKRGEEVTVCYGVAKTRSLRLEPIGMGLPPSPKNCARIYPPVSGTYTLVATGEGGTDRQSFRVEVK